MTNQEILFALSSIKKGTYTHITKSKDLGNGVTKISELAMRIGCNYANLAINADKQTEPLKWGHWVEGLENLVIEHKGNYYLRVTSKTPANLDGADIISQTYLMNGVVVDAQIALAAADPRKCISGPSPVYNIKFENILSIGNAR